MISLRATTYGDAQRMRGLLMRTRRVVSDIGPALPRIARRLRQQLARQFRQEGEGSPSGRWARLSPSYAAWKARRYPGAGILVRTGALMASLASEGPGSITLYGPSSVFVGSSVAYAIYHQTGAGPLPRRAPIEPTDRDVSEWVQELWRHIEGESVKLGWAGRFAGAMA